MKLVTYGADLLSGRKKVSERLDCTVMAWANCFDCTYHQAHSWLNRFGRKNQKPMLYTDLEKALKACTKSKVKIGPYGREVRGITLNQFLKKHSHGRYYVCFNDHALCVKDGVVYDHSERGRRLVIFAARVYLEGEI